MSNSDKITVKVTITERVKYSTLVQLTRQQFEEMDDVLGYCRCGDAGLSAA